MSTYLVSESRVIAADPQRLFDIVAFGSRRDLAVAQRHQLRDAVAMVDHRLAAHFGRMRGQDGRDQGMVEQAHDLVLADPLIGQPLQRRRDIRARLGGDTLTVLGEIGEHREQHETAHEIERLVERQAIQPEIDVPADAAMAID